MGVIDRLAALIEGLLRLVSEGIRIAIVDPFSRDAAYRTGFFSGLVVAFVVGSVSLWVLRWWADVRRYFNATPRSFDPGPSPRAISGGCRAAVIRLILLLLLIIIFVIGLLRAIVGA